MGGRTIMFAACLVASGCALALSTSDYAGGVRPTAEGGVRPTADGGEIADAPAGSDAPSTSTAFCAAQANGAFCADFDDGSFNAKAWTSVTLTGNGALRVDTTETRSPPGALLATTAVTDGNQYPAAFVARALGANHPAHMEADVFVHGTDESDTTARIFGYQVGVNALLELDGDGAIQVAENWKTASGTIQFAYHGAGTYPLETWFHLAVDLDVDTKILTVTLNGTAISDGTPLAGPFDATTPDAVVGLYYAQTKDNGWSVRFDNVVIDDH